MPFPITFWCGVPSDFMCEQRLAEIRESGCNLITGDYGVEGNQRVLKLCEKYGLRMTVEDPRLGECVRQPELIDTLLPAVAADYRAYPALFSYHIKDEPSTADFPVLSRIVARLKELDPEHEAYINLFPNYATPEMLGAATYQEHVARFLDEVKPEILSYDHYHFLKAAPVQQRDDFADDRERQIYLAAQAKSERGGFFDNLEVIRAQALAHRVPFMLIVLVAEHGPYRYLTEAEIRYEAFQALAYGAARMSYFPYWTPDYEEVWKYQNGMISQNGHRTQHFYDVQHVNLDLAKIGRKTAATSSVKVMHAGAESESVTPFSAFGGITEITGGRCTVGFFKNGLILLANKDWEQAATLCCKAESAPRCYNPQDEAWSEIPFDEEEQAYLIPLQAGGGCLIRF